MFLNAGRDCVQPDALGRVGPFCTRSDQRPARPAAVCGSPCPGTVFAQAAYEEASPLPPSKVPGWWRGSTVRGPVPAPERATAAAAGDAGPRSSVTKAYARSRGRRDQRAHCPQRRVRERSRGTTAARRPFQAVPVTGRLRAEQAGQRLLPALTALAEPDEPGDPMLPPRWTTKSLRHGRRSDPAGASRDRAHGGAAAHRDLRPTPVHADRPPPDRHERRRMGRSAGPVGPGLRRRPPNNAAMCPAGEGALPRPAAAALLTGADGVLLAVVRLRRVCPQQRCRPTCSESTPSPSARPSRRPDTLAGLFDVSRRTLRNAIRDVRPVLDARHLVITPAGTGTPRQPTCPARSAGHLPETTQTLPAAGMSIPDGCRWSGITGLGTAGRQLADRTRSCAAAAIW
jgi:hypothetical protein